MITYSGIINFTSELSFSQARQVYSVIETHCAKEKACLEIVENGRGIRWNGNPHDKLEFILADVMAFLSKSRIEGVGVIKVYKNGSHLYDIVALRNFIKVFADGHLTTITPKIP